MIIFALKTAAALAALPRYGEHLCKASLESLPRQVFLYLYFAKFAHEVSTSSLI